VLRRAHKAEFYDRESDGDAGRHHDAAAGAGAAAGDDGMTGAPAAKRPRTLWPEGGGEGSQVAQLKRAAAEALSATAGVGALPAVGGTEPMDADDSAGGGGGSS